MFSMSKKRGLCLLLVLIQVFFSFCTDFNYLEAKKEQKREKKIRKKSALITTLYPAGMFSHFLAVIGTLELFERGVYQGVDIDFSGGLYCEESYGNDWWYYYFEPMNLPAAGHYKTVKYTWVEYHFAHNIAYGDITAERAYELISKYIKVKPFISEIVDHVVADEFGADCTIGIHYRGTDKITSGEARFIPYTEIMHHVINEVRSLGTADYKIFVATDSVAFLKFMQEAFPGKIVFQDAYRSSGDEAVHMKNDSPFEAGKQALVDTLLLAKCQVMFRTDSNLSLCAMYLNPDMPTLTIR